MATRVVLTDRLDYWATQLARNPASALRRAIVAAFRADIRPVLTVNGNAPVGGNVDVTLSGTDAPVVTELSRRVDSLAMKVSLYPRTIAGQAPEKGVVTVTAAKVQAASAAQLAAMLARLDKLDGGTGPDLPPLPGGGVSVLTATCGAGPGIGELVVSWTLSENPPAGWEVSCDGVTAGGASVASITVPGTSRTTTFRSLVPGSMHSVSVSGVLASGRIVSAQATGTATTPAPSGTLDVRVAVTDSTATVTWTADVNPAAGWYVGRDGQDATGFGPWGETVPGTTRQESFTVLSPGTTYTFTVKDAGAGATLSKAVTAKTTGTPGTTPPPSGGGPLPGTAMSRLGIQSRTGLPWLTAWFSEHNSINHDSFGVLNGSGKMDGIIGFSPTNTLAEWNNVGFATGAYASGFGGYFCFEFSPMTSWVKNQATGQYDPPWTWQDIANGKIDSHADIVADGLIGNGFGDRCIIRLAEEASGDWYPWRINSSNLAAYKAGFRRVSQRLKARLPKALIGYELVSTTMIPGLSGTPLDHLRAAYPGDDVVDIVLMDTYDSGAFGVTNLADAPRAWRPAEALAVGWAVDFARERGKPFGIPEWGCTHSGYLDGHGDNPVFIRAMYEFLQANRDVVLFESYWNMHRSDNTVGAIFGPTLMPLARAEYQRLWSQR